MTDLRQGWINHSRTQARNDQAATASTEDVEDAILRLLFCAQTASGDPTCADLSSTRQRLKSPTTTVKAGDRTRTPSPNRRSKPKPTTADESTADFAARPAPRTKGRLWNEGDPTPTIPIPHGTRQHNPQQSLRRDHNRVSSQDVEEEDSSVNKMIGQPETRAISQDQLLAELKGIYAGLVMPESKDIAMSSYQSAQNDSSPQWQAAIAAYQTLLHEHHDYSFTSQRRPTPLALRRLASKYAMPTRMWCDEICVIRGLESHKPPGSSKHMLAYSTLALHHDIVPDRYGYFNERTRALYPRPTELIHDQKVESMIFPRTEEPPPAEWSSLRLLWADNVSPSDLSKSEIFDEDERQLEHLPTPRDNHGRVPWGLSKDGYSRSPGLYSEAFDNLQSMVHANNLFTPGHYSIPLSLLSNIPRKFHLLAVLASAAIPIVSANVGMMEWTFGTLASIPSTYVLANPPVPPIVENGAEQIVWKFARAWGLTFGLVFAALLVARLRTNYPRDKQMYFVSVVFATSIAVMLLLLHFMRDGTWNIFDLLSLCVCFCAAATYIATSESRGRDTVIRNRDEEEGAYQYLQDTPARIQSDQHPRVQGGHQPES